MRIVFQKAGFPAPVPETTKRRGIRTTEFSRLFVTLEYRVTHAILSHLAAGWIFGVILDCFRGRDINISPATVGSVTGRHVKRIRASVGHVQLRKCRRDTVLLILFGIPEIVPIR